MHQNVIQATTLSSYSFLVSKKAVTFEVGSYGVDKEQLSCGVSVVNDFLYVAWQTQQEAFITINDVETPVYSIKYHQQYSVGKVKFIGDIKNFDRVEKHQVIAYVDDMPNTGRILFYPAHWFDNNSPTKVDGAICVA